MEFKFDIAAVESLILAAPEPLAARRIADVIDEATPSAVTAAVTQLNNRYTEAVSSFRIREIAGGFQFHIIPEYSGYVEELFARQRKLRLTRASLETLAIVAYRQPVTKTNIEHIRGVASDGVVHNLLEKKLITIAGRAETVGRPLQYGTTAEFLKFFGLNALTDLPQMREIEELLKAEESTNQTKLELSAREEEFVKFNVADGIFNLDQDGKDSSEQTTSDQPQEQEPEIEVAAEQPAETSEPVEPVELAEAVELSDESLRDESLSSDDSETVEPAEDDSDAEIPVEVIASLAEEDSIDNRSGDHDSLHSTVGVIVDVDAT